MIYRANASLICALALFCFVPGNATAQATETHLGLSAIPNPSLVGQQVAFTALVNRELLTSTVQFTDGSANLGSAILGPIQGGCSFSPCSFSVATLQTSALTPGSHSITATFGGDALNAPSSGTVTQIVIAAASSATTPTLSSWVMAMLALFVGGLGMRFAWRSRG